MTPPAAPRRMVSLALIDADDRLRPADPAWVAVIAASMAAPEALINPIWIRPVAGGRFALVAGLHRLEAFRLKGWTEILSEQRDLTSGQARLVEIDENLMRRELGALDRAIFLAERKRVWEEIYPTSAHGKAKTKQYQGQTQTDILSVCSFSKDAAERTGLTERTIRRSVALVADLAPEAVAAIRGTYLEDHAADLAKLAEMPVADQRVAALRLAGGEIRRLGDLTPRDRLPADEAQFKAVMDAWNRASAKARRRVLAQVGAIYRHQGSKAERAEFDAALERDEAVG